jgi:hypothetical protein
MAGACVFMACKVEECGRKLRTIASTCVVKALKTDKMEEHEAVGQLFHKILDAI